MAYITATDVGTYLQETLVSPETTLLTNILIPAVESYVEVKTGKTWDAQDAASGTNPIPKDLKLGVIQRCAELLQISRQKTLTAKSKQVGQIKVEYSTMLSQEQPKYFEDVIFTHSNMVL